MHTKAGAELGDDALMGKTNAEVLPRHIKCMDISFPITLNKTTQHEARSDSRHSCMSALLALSSHPVNLNLLEGTVPY